MTYKVDSSTITRFLAQDDGSVDEYVMEPVNALYENLGRHHDPVDFLEVLSCRQALLHVVLSDHEFMIARNDFRGQANEVLFVYKEVFEEKFNANLPAKVFSIVDMGRILSSMMAEFAVRGFDKLRQDFKHFCSREFFDELNESMPAKTHHGKAKI